MTKFSAQLAAFLTIAATALGCELIATVDRTKIPGNGGAGGQSTTSTSTSSTSTSSTSGGGGAGGMNTGGMNTGGMGTGGMGTGGMAPECKVPTDCMGQDTECQQRSCDKGVCGFVNTPADTPLSAMNQNAGDCLVVVCDGNGGVTNKDDDADVFDDGNQCTEDTCQAGMPSNKPSSPGTSCSANNGKMCDGMGACVECLAAADCVSNVCTQNKCVPASCADNVKNGDETDKDCGGTCGQCDDLKACAVAADCKSGICSGMPLSCQVPACDDMVKNGNETDKDCGGSCTKKCAVGEGCTVDADCLGGSCSGTTCLPSCTDTVQNGSESDVDCGGTCTTKCAVGKKCAAGADCVEGVCGASNTCSAAACNDNVKNGGETDTDCGGSCAPALKCAPGLKCAVAGDCTSGVCTGGVCQVPNCMDMVQNGGETDKDCGGATCGGCGIGLKCAVNGDCLSGNCKLGICQAATCGDGIKNGAEGCDDGNTASGDGCSATCAVESGYACTGTAPSVCAPICGDGQIKSGEGCDDGNTASNDGCSSACAQELGYTCTGAPSVCTSTCGDGIKAFNEQCDDGNTVSGDGCSAACVKETGWTCTGNQPSVCVTTCGDGLKAGAESCDDGNNANNDGCSSACAIETGFTCTGSAPTVCAAICGDGLIKGAETCDDGNTVGGDGCSSGCTVQAGYTCVGEPSSCTAGCGDGIVAGTEECDDGNLNSNDGCSSACIKEFGYTCTGSPSVCTSTCGDGLKAFNEACDDGNTANGDGCSPSCAIETGWLCSGNAPSTCSAICGDGIKVGAETCDDGNTVAGDGCSTACATEAGWTCTGAPSVCTTTCGDGIKAGTETCDDGNVVSLDGCSSKCKLEGGYTCTGAPSVCTSAVEINCGDGVDNDGNGLTDCADPACALHCNTNVGPCAMGETALVYTSTDVPKAIPDSPAAGVNSTISVGAGGIVKRAVIQLDITHTFDADVDILLFSPSNVSTDVSSDNGSSGDNYTATIFNTNCATAITAAAATPPYTSCFKPEAAFTAYNNGGSAGTWRLNVADDASGDTGTLNSWRLALCVTPTNCGDGQLDAGETCDDNNSVSGDGCAAACTVETGFSCTGIPSVCTPICGDGQKKGSEQCDDGNTANGDGCSSTCQWEAGTEVESNNTCATANGPFTIPTHATGALINAAMNPATEQDWFLFTVPVYADLWFETFDPSGPGSCTPTTIDTIIQLFKADCTTQQSTAQDQGGINNCSRLNPTTQPTTMTHIPPGTYALKVTNFTTTSTYNYMLQAKYVAFCGNGIKEGSEECDGGAGCNADCTLVPVCGNGTVQSTEICDDGNTNNGDGCDSNCKFEGFTNEIEPNNSTAEADANGLVISGDSLFVGSIAKIGDKDYYKLNVTAQSTIRFETFDNPAFDCSAATSTTLRLYNSGGTQIATDLPDTAASGILNCAALVYNLAAGTYYIQVERTGNTAAITKYFLQVKFATDLGTETEANDAFGMANALTVTNPGDVVVFGAHQLLTDADWYAITLPVTSSIRAEIIEGDTSETCESLGIDSTLTLFGTNGTTTLVTDFDDGRGWCSAIDGTGTTARDSGAKNLMPGTYFLRVTSNGTTGASNQFNYRLVVTVR